MKHLIRSILLISVLWLTSQQGALAQASVSLYCWNPTGSQATNNQFVPCNAANPLVVSTSGGGGGAVFGPTAVGSTNANPPVVVGGTATGAAGQNVQGLSIVAPSVAPVTATNTAVVVDLRPDSPGIVALGQTTKSASVPSVIASDQMGPNTAANSLPVVSSSQYPANAVTTTPTPLVAKGAGSTGAVTGTLTPGSTATAYVCGFNVSYVGGVAQIGPLVLSGLLGGSFTFQLPVSTATGGNNFSQAFSPCIPASAVNTPIVMTTVADGTATAVDVNIWGYGL